MADFNANVILNVKDSSAQRAVKKLEDALAAASNKANVLATNVEAASRKIKDLKIPDRNFALANKQVRELNSKLSKSVELTKRLEAVRVSRAERQAGNSSLTQGLQSIGRAEQKARLEAARDIAQAEGEAAAAKRVQAKSDAAAAAAAKNQLQIEKETTAEINKQARAADKAAKTRKRQSEDRKKRIVGGLLEGVGFPLLFGGGPGAVIGGAIGGAAGGALGVGFGLQAVVSAVGTAVDQFVASTAKLGQALNPLTADVSAVAEAAGLTGTPLARLVQELEQAGQKTAALKLATEVMASVIGQEGVRALRDAGDAASELGREASKAFTALSAALAPALEAVASFLAKNISEQRQLSRTDQGFLGFGQGDLANNDEVRATRDALALGVIDETEARKRLLEIVQQIEEAELRAAETKAETTGYARAQVTEAENLLQLSRNELEISKLGGDIKNDNVYTLQRENIELSFAIKQQEVLNQLAEAEGNERARNILLLQQQKLEVDKQLAIQDLANRRVKAFESAARSSARSAASAPKSKALQLQAQTIKNEQKLFDIKVKYRQLTEGEAVALRATNANTYTRLQQELEILNLQEQQALKSNKVAGDEALIRETFKQKRQIVEDTLSLERQQNIARINALETEQRILKVKRDQQEADLSTQLNRNFEDVQRRIASPLGGFDAERLELKIEQTRRYEDAMRDLNKQQAINEELLANPTLTKKQKITIEENNKSLERQKQLYKEMLPAIAAAEQQQLKLQQTLQTLQPFTNALAAGITDVFVALVDETKSVEEAFANMFKNIGQEFLNMATKILQDAITQQLLKLFGNLLGGFTGAPTGIGAGAQSIGQAFGGLRADGGPVNQNIPYIVGEQGPEVFVPGKSGTILSNDVAFSDSTAALAGASQAFAETNEAMEMAMATRSANTATAAEASALQTAETYFAAGKSTVTFDTYRVGEMDVVTREDAIRIGQQSAKQAEANVYKGLRNMPAVRSRSGVK